jgi:hypothetical protein
MAEQHAKEHSYGYGCYEIWKIEHATENFSPQQPFGLQHQGEDHSNRKLWNDGNYPNDQSIDEALKEVSRSEQTLVILKLNKSCSIAQWIKVHEAEIERIENWIYSKQCIGYKKRKNKKVSVSATLF